MIIPSKRAIAAATAAAIALTSMTFAPAMAAPVSKHQAVTAAGDTDFSSARRHRRGASHRAVLGAMAGVAGIVGGLAAREHYRRQYDRGPYYGAYDNGYNGYNRGYGGGQCPNGGYYSHHYGTGWGCY
jgi:hypothetical protein